MLADAQAVRCRDQVGAVTGNPQQIGDVIIGQSPGRTSPNDITLFDSVGIAMQDLAIGNLLIEAARRAGLGQEFDFAGARI